MGGGLLVTAAPSDAFLSPGRGVTREDLADMLGEQTAACGPARDALIAGGAFVIWDGLLPANRHAGTYGIRLRHTLRRGHTVEGLAATVDILGAAGKNFSASAASTRLTSPQCSRSSSTPQRQQWWLAREGLDPAPRTRRSKTPSNSNPAFVTPTALRLNAASASSHVRHPLRVHSMSFLPTAWPISLPCMRQRNMVGARRPRNTTSKQMMADRGRAY